MSNTALVRSTSAPTGFAISSSSPKPSTPKATSTTTLPKLTASPQPRATTTQTRTPTPQPSTPSNSTPGQWQHPRMSEVLARRSKSTFDTSNMWRIAVNLAFLLFTFVAPPMLYAILPRESTLPVRPWWTRLILLLRALPLLNIALALLPLLRLPDRCEDVPLMPMQRQLLGLPPMSRPATPQEKDAWITPPRYTRSRSATPNSARNSASGSPLAQAAISSPSQSPMGGSQRRTSANSPSFTPQSERRRLSYTTRNSPLGTGDFEESTSASGLLSTPTRKGNRASVGLNRKWLYEKGMGKGSPRSPGGWDPKGWGTGSVFN